MTEIIELDTPPIAVHLRVNRRARRFTLRLGEPGQGAILTLPPGVPRSEARMFLLRQSGWLETALSRRPDLVRMEEGAEIPVDGVPLTLRLMDGPRRPPVIDGETLRLSGPHPAGPRIAAWLKTRARDRMVPAVHRYAGMLGRRVSGVSLKDTRTRWGSCSSNARVNLSWRLAMAPPEVQEYLTAHEAAHLVEMNHSERYWAVLARLMPDYQAPRAWLRREGRGLHAYVFDA